MPIKDVVRNAEGLAEGDTVSTIIAALRAGIGENQMMAYLVEMAG